MRVLQLVEWSGWVKHHFLHINRGRAYTVRQVLFDSSQTIAGETFTPAPDLNTTNTNPFAICAML